MSKNLTGNYNRIPRIFWNRYKNGKLVYESPYINLSTKAKWLYITLKDYENAFTGFERDLYREHIPQKYHNEDWFYVDDKTLAKQANIRMTSFKEAKKELQASGLIECFLIPRNIKNPKENGYHVTGYVLYP